MLQVIRAIMKRVATIWAALVRWSAPHGAYFGIVGAAVVLASWAVTNTISIRLVSARAALDRAATEDRLGQRLERMRRADRESKATLSRLDLMISEAHPDSIFSTFPPRSGEDGRRTYALLVAADTHFIEHESLQEAIYAVEVLQASGGVPEGLRQEVTAAVEPARETLLLYNDATTRWDQLRRRSIDLIKTGKANPVLFQKATAHYIQAVVPLQERSIKQREALLRAHSKFMEHLTQRLNRLSSINENFQVISWLLYALGSCLAIFGKWLETHEKKQSALLNRKA